MVKKCLILKWFLLSNIRIFRRRNGFWGFFKPKNVFRNKNSEIWNLFSFLRVLQCLRSLSKELYLDIWSTKYALNICCYKNYELNVPKIRFRSPFQLALVAFQKWYGRNTAVFWLIGIRCCTLCRLLTVVPGLYSTSRNPTMESPPKLP